MEEEGGKRSDHLIRFKKRGGDDKYIVVLLFLFLSVRIEIVSGDFRKI